MMFKGVTVFVFLMSSMCFIGVAQAGDPPGESRDDKSIKIAQKLFDQGAKAYASGDYMDALMSFRKAYTYESESLFLYNAARAAERLGNLDQALSLAKDAKADKGRSLTSRLTDKNDALIKKLDALIDERAAELASQRRGQWSWLGYSGVATGVVGLGLVGGSIYLSNTVSSEITDISRVNDAELYDQKREEIRTSQSVGQVLLYSGIGLAALGGSAVALDLFSRGESPFSVSMNPINSGVGFSVAGEF